MPAPGDQHKPNGALILNPFNDSEQQDQKHIVSAYTAAEIATLSSRLEKQLGPEWISSRSGPGGAKVYYIEAHKAISLANEVFGFNGWSSSIQNIQIDFVDENSQTGKVSLGLSVTMRITLKDGTYHEDIGYGHVENAKGKAAAFEKAKKQGTSDGLKRTLRTFGQVLGNCLQDKDYLGKVTKMKIGAGKWDPDELYRHTDFAAKKESAVKAEPKQPAQSTNSDTTRIVTEDSFDGIEFDDAVFDDDEFGNHDKFVLPAEPQDAAKQLQAPVAPAAAMPKPLTTPSRLLPGPKPVHGPRAAQQIASEPPRVSHVSASRVMSAHDSKIDGGLAMANPSGGESEQSSSPGIPSQHFNINPGPISGVGRGTGFFSAKAAEHIDENNNVVSGSAQTFNPYSESRSLRRNPNIDHTTSMRLNRHLKPEPAPEPDQPSEGLHAMPTNQPRRPLVPGQSPQTPTALGRGFGTSHYRPPTRRGPDGAILAPAASNLALHGVDKVLQSNRRPPLTDLSNVHNQYQSTATTYDGTDAKRQRIDGSGQSAVMDENGLPGEAG